MIEVCFKSDIELSLGLSQVSDYIFLVVSGVSSFSRAVSSHDSQFA